MTADEHAHVQKLEGLVKRYRSRIVRLKQALAAAQQFIDPEISRGPAVNGWQNTVDFVADVLNDRESL